MCPLNVLVILRVIIDYADLTITTDKLMELFASVVNSKEVDRLGEGYEIDLPSYEVDKIKKNYQSPTQRKEAYLDLYVDEHPCPTWQQVAKVLRDTFKLNQPADFVKNTYVKGTQDVASLSYVNKHVLH